MTAGLPILYTFRRCPYAMRGRMALARAGVRFEWREILLRNKPAAMLEASPKGTVPVMVLPDGLVIDESLDVMLWALAQNDPENWLPDNAEDRQVVFDLIARNDGPFKQNLDRYKYSMRYEDADKEGERTAGYEVIKDLNSRLESTGFLVGDKLGLTDIAVFPFIRQFRIADPEWFDTQDIPAVHKWLKTRMESELFLSIMPKQPLWTPESEPSIFEGLETA